MILLGHTNKLQVTNVNGDDIFLDAKNFGIVRATNNDFIAKYKKGDIIDVFLYPDGENTNACVGDAYANLGDFAFLSVVANTKVGSFFDMGTDKDLFCPFSEQKIPLIQNKSYIVYIYIDKKTNRMVASTKIERFISKEKPEFEENQNVNTLIINQTDMGFSAIVENKYLGLLYENEVFTKIEIGTKQNAVVKKIREDGKIDLRMYRNDHSDIEMFEKQIVDFLKKNNNIMNITDNSNPEKISTVFGISKKNFKKAIGGLYRKKIIEIHEDEIRLI